MVFGCGVLDYVGYASIMERCCGDDLCSLPVRIPEFIFFFRTDDLYAIRSWVVTPARVHECLDLMGVGYQAAMAAGMSSVDALESFCTRVDTMYVIILSHRLT